MLYSGDLVQNKKTGKVGVVYDYFYDTGNDKHLVKVYYDKSPNIWVRASCFTLVTGLSARYKI